jgi:hypothetical protein
MNYLYPLADLSQLNLDKILTLIKDINKLSINLIGKNNAWLIKGDALYYL